MRNDANGIGEYSNSPAGQGCLWVAVIGVVGILGLSYLSSYTGMPEESIDRVENGIAGATRPTKSDGYSTTRSHRRHIRHRTVEQAAE